MLCCVEQVAISSSNKDSTGSILFQASAFRTAVPGTGLDAVKRRGGPNGAMTQKVTVRLHSKARKQLPFWGGFCLRIAAKRAAHMCACRHGVGSRPPQVRQTLYMLVVLLEVAEVAEAAEPRHVRPALNPKQALDSCDCWRISDTYDSVDLGLYGSHPVAK